MKFCPAHAATIARFQFRPLGGELWRVTVWKCGTQGPIIIRDSVGTEEMVVDEWNAWVAENETLKDDE